MKILFVGLFVILNLIGLSVAFAYPTQLIVEEECESAASSGQLSKATARWCAAETGRSYRVGPTLRKSKEGAKGCTREVKPAPPDYYPTEYSQFFVGADGQTYVSELYCSLHAWDPTFYRALSNEARRNARNTNR